MTDRNIDDDPMYQIPCCLINAEEEGFVYVPREDWSETIGLVFKAYMHENERVGNVVDNALSRMGLSETNCMNLMSSLEGYVGSANDTLPEGVTPIYPLAEHLYLPEAPCEVLLNISAYIFDAMKSNVMTDEELKYFAPLLNKVSVVKDKPVYADVIDIGAARTRLQPKPAK